MLSNERNLEPENTKNVKKEMLTESHGVHHGLYIMGQILRWYKSKYFQLFEWKCTAAVDLVHRWQGLCFRKVILYMQRE